MPSRVPTHLASLSTFQPDIEQSATLLASHPAPVFVDTLLNDLTHGARIGYEGDRSGIRIENNHASALEHADLISADIAKNVQEGVTIGPFEDIPFSYARISPLGALLKTRGVGSLKVRRIHDLSFPRGDSVNSHIPKDYVATSYTYIRDIIRESVLKGKGTTMGIVDIESTFKHYPIHPQDVPLLGFQWDGKYYFEVTLPFGLRSSPGLYDRLVDALTWIMQTQGVESVFRFVDDHFMPTAPEDDPDFAVDRFCDLCDLLKVEYSREKLKKGELTAIYIGRALSSTALSLLMEVVVGHKTISDFINRPNFYKCLFFIKSTELK